MDINKISRAVGLFLKKADDDADDTLKPGNIPPALRGYVTEDSGDGNKHYKSAMKVYDFALKNYQNKSFELEKVAGEKVTDMDDDQYADWKRRYESLQSDVGTLEVKVKKYSGDYSVEVTVNTDGTVHSRIGEKLANNITSQGISDLVSRIIGGDGYKLPASPVVWNAFANDKIEF